MEGSAEEHLQQLESDAIGGNSGRDCTDAVSKVVLEPQ